MSDTVSFKSMMKDKNFFKIFTSGVISRFGDGVESIVFALIVYEMTDSPVLFALLLVASGVPSLIFNMVSGVMVTRWPKKTVVWVCDIIRGSSVILTAILYMTGYLQVWHLFAFTAINSIIEAYRSPSSGALFAQLIAKEKLEHATSLNTSGRTLAELSGFGVGAVLLSTLGPAMGIVLNGITFYIAGLILMTIVREKEELVKEKLDLKSYRSELKEGFDYVMKVPIIKTLTFFMGGMMLLFTPFNALQSPYILGDLKLGANGIVVLSLSFMISMIIGSLMVPSLTKKFGGRKVFLFGGMVVATGYLMMSGLVIFSGQITGYIGLGITSVIMGSTLTFLQVPTSVTLMREVDRAVMTRVFSLMNVLALSSIPLGAAMSAFLVAFVDINTMFIITSIGIFILFITQIWNKALYKLNYHEEETKDQGADPLLEDAEITA